VISGGNPGLFDLKLLLAELLSMGQYVMVETQGTEFKEWMLMADEICVSPKGPTMMGRPEHQPFEETEAFLRNFEENRFVQSVYLKVVLFSPEDYAYAVELHERHRTWPMFLSIGTQHAHAPTVAYPHGKGAEQSHIRIRTQVSNSFAYFADVLSHDLRMRDVKILPQLHVVAWGDERGR